MFKGSRLLLGLIALLLLNGCATSRPVELNNICDIFDEKDDWYDDALEAKKRWGTPIPIAMSIIYQESRFEAKARPPRTKLLWVIPWKRQSSAYGYSQAKNSTWDWYLKEAGGWASNRSDFADAVDFVGWYNYKSHTINGIRRDDAYSLYLAYHEGHGGYSRGTYRGKSWLIGVASKVNNRAAMYQKQLYGCEERLRKKGWWPFW